WAAAVGAPWACLPGFQWSPAEVASGALQSPFSCRWKPCSPGVRPVTSPVTCSPPSAFVKLIVPAALLPEAAARVTVASAAQADVARTNAAETASARCLFMAFAPRPGTGPQSIFTTDAG